MANYADKSYADKRKNKSKRKPNILQKAGSMTMIPYALKSAGLDELAEAAGFPMDEDGTLSPEYDIRDSLENKRKRGEKVSRKKPPLQALSDAMGFEDGGDVKGYKGGGKVRGYKDGGGVCRGGGAAVSGTKFSGVK